MFIIHKFNLNEYLDKTHKKFIYFDILMKINKINKEELLTSLNIAQSSYRRSRLKEQNIGKEIIDRLIDNFKINPITDNQMVIYEELLSNIYQAIYYKAENILDLYITQLEQCINDNNILLPIFKLFMVLLKLTNSSNTPNENRKENELLFSEIILYENYYTDEIKVLLRIIELIIMPKSLMENDAILLSIKVPYSNSLLYFTLVTKNYMFQNYPMALYYSILCERILIQDSNYSRLTSLYLTKCVCLNALGHYQECYDIAKKQIVILYNQNKNQLYLFSMLNQYFVACLGLKKEAEIINYLQQKEDKKRYDYLFLILAYYGENSLKEAQNTYIEFSNNENTNQPNIYKEVTDFTYKLIFNEDTINNQIALENLNINVGLKVFINKLKK